MLASSHREQSMQLCPQCKTLVRNAATFCHACGRKLPSLKKAISHPLGDDYPEMFVEFCPRCQMPVHNQAKFCPACGRKLPDLKKGNRIGNYIVERLLGVGGIGAVYLSHHRLLKLRVAVKIHDYFPENEYVGRAFLRSSNYLSQLDHSNIVHLYDYGFQNRKAYQAIEYINGPTFAQLRPHQQTKSWIDRCIGYFAQMLAALHYAHTCQYIDFDGTLRQGIIHGDIKPHNIFLDNNTDTVKLSDFMIPDVQAFLGKESSDFQDIDEITIVYGTPAYMPPEQKEGKLSPQTDIFSLGVTMFQLVTGYSPTSANGTAMLWRNIPPHHENPYIPAWLSNLIMKSLQRDPIRRFQTIAEMIQIFQANRNQEKPSVPILTSHVSNITRQRVIGEFNSIVDSLNTTSQGELVQVLKLLKEAITLSTKISTHKKQEFIKIINQIGEEATEIVPNRTFLRIITDGLLTTLKTISDRSLIDIVEMSASILEKQYKMQNQTGDTIRVLFLAANPKDTPQLRLDEEIRGIDFALRQADSRERFDIVQHWAVRVADLQGYLLRHSPDIVHFSGHGSSSNQIILEDASGNSHPVSDRALSQVFSVLKDNIRCIVLNCCYSEPQAQAIAQHIDCVIGMSQSIGDTAAISFATAFYQALGYGRNVKTAFDLGCLQIDLESLDEQNTPKLLAINSNPANILFTGSKRESHLL
jgi:serine/threonine protein kinase/RNA polymerase subunit RPABC4/transcription elongation factor Spt4